MSSERARFYGACLRTPALVAKSVGLDVREIQKVGEKARRAARARVYAVLDGPNDSRTIDTDDPPALPLPHGNVCRVVRGLRLHRPDPLPDRQVHHGHHRRPRRG